MAETMKALLLTRPSPDSPPTFALTTVPKPTPKEGEVLVKVHASAIQPSDIINSKGGFPYTTFPRIPGRDFSGTVVGAPSHLLNQQIYSTSGNTLSFTSDGAHAQYISLPTSSIAPKPTNLSFAQSATIGVPFTTASLALKKSELKQGETVLILGANGAVGSAASQLAASQHANVLKGLRGAGGDVDTSADPELKGLEGKKVDVVIDTVGVPGLTSAAAKRLTRGGRLVFIAAPRKGSTILDIEMLDFYRNEKKLIGVNTLLYSSEEFVKEMKEMTPLFESGVLRAPKEGEWKEVKLEEGVEAYEKGGKVVLVMD